MKKPERGFSITELLIVVGIIGVLALTAAPNFISLMRNMTLKSSMRDFTSKLRNARQTAVTRNELVKVSFLTGTGKRTYTIYHSPNVSTPTWTQLAVYQLDKSIYFGPTTFEDDDDPGDSVPDVVFRPSGSLGNTPIPTETENGNPVTLIRLRTDWALPVNEFKIYCKFSGNFETKNSHF